VDESEALRQNQNPFTTEDTKDTEEEKSQTFETQRNGGSGEEGLPRMDADGRGFEQRPKPVEWKPTPDMYRMDTPEGRAAYEARFGVKIGPSSGDRVIGRSGDRQTQDLFTAKPLHGADAEGAKESWVG
jgi:hypothetical protein